MRVDKLARGYRIVCSQSEYEALVYCVRLGSAEGAMDNYATQPAAVKKVLRSERWNLIEGPLFVDPRKPK